VLPYVRQVVSDVDAWCKLAHGGRRFIELPPGLRERALEERMGLRGGAIRSWYVPVYEGILALAKLSFFGALTTPVGTNFVGFPGPSTGYAAASAAGAYHADTPRIPVGGGGRVSALHVTGDVVARVRERVTLRLRAPDGSVHAVGEAPAVDVEIPRARGISAEGVWSIELVGAGRLHYWSFTLRTDLDEAMG
jgi:hypothetical protein